MTSQIQKDNFLPDISSKNMAMSSRKTMVAPYRVRTIETGGKEVVICKWLFAKKYEGHGMTYLCMKIAEFWTGLDF